MNRKGLYLAGGSALDVVALIILALSGVDLTAPVFSIGVALAAVIAVVGAILIWRGT